MSSQQQFAVVKIDWGGDYVQNFQLTPKPKTRIKESPTFITGKPGYLIIFNQQEFTREDLLYRTGSDVDVENLRGTFREFGFDPIVKRDLKLAEIEEEASNLETKDFQEFDCCVIVILSHGSVNGTLYAADESYTLREMFFDRLANNESLREKPKIFIVSACKGDAIASINMDTDAIPDRPSQQEQPPLMTDFLLCNSTYEGYASKRHPEEGTIFVQELCKQLKLHGQTKYFEDILKQVIESLSINFGQVSSVETTMRFNFCFGDLKR